MFAPRIGQDPIQLFSTVEERKIAVAVRAASGTLDESTLRAYVEANPGKLDPAVVDQMIATMNKQPPPGSSSQAKARTQTNQLQKKQAELEAKFTSAFRRFVIGQDHAVGRLAQKMSARNLRESDEPVPMNMALPGPPGVGKTESIKAMAQAIHGDPTMFVEINCSKYQKSEDLAGLLGAPPGYVGSGKTADTSPMSMRNIQKKFGDKRPILILWDEVDKIGGGDPKVKEDFFKILGNFMQSGRFEFVDTSCPPTEIPDCINFFTSNEGMETAQGLTGKSLRDHYIKSMRGVLPQHIQSRIAQNFIGYDPLSMTDRMDIAKLKIGKQLRKAEEKTAKDKGFAIKLDVDESVLRLFAEITGSDLFGARPLEDLIRDFVGPLIPDVRRRANAGEVWQLTMMKRFNDSDDKEVEITRQAVNKLKDAYVKALESGSAPEHLEIPFPIEFKCLNPKRTLNTYDGAVPMTPGARMYPHAAGAVGGQRFALVNRGGPEDMNELFILKPGRTEAADRYMPVSLPPELAAANTFCAATAIDESHALFYAVNTPPDGTEAQTVCFLCTAEGGSFKFEQVQSPGEAINWPELALVGAALGGGDGKAVLWGGRHQEQDGQGNWSVRPDPQDNMGEAIQNTAFAFDVKTKQWTHLPEAPKGGRVGAATAYANGKLYFIGGEEIVRDEHHHTDTSQSSAAVDVLDLKTMAFSEGPALQNGVQFATAFADPSGTLYVLGGQQLTDGGRQPQATRAMRMLGANGEWLEENVPYTGLNLMVIPHVDGNQVIGPFGDNDEFLIRRPPTELERGE